MSAIQEPFFVAYYGVSTKITPIVNHLNMVYLVELPTRSVLVHTIEDSDVLSVWVEVTSGRTTFSEEIGAIIESRDM